MNSNKLVSLTPSYPVIHRRKVPFRPAIQVPEDFVERAERIKMLDLELDRFFLSLKDYIDLVGDAYASNIHFSTKIEGNPLPLQEVRRLTRKSLREGLPEKVPDAPRQEIINHLFVWLSPESVRPPWTADHLRRTHKFLMTDVSQDARPGEFRDHEGAVYSDQGQEVFKTCPPQHIVAEMDSLLDWTNRIAPSLNPIVGAAVFFHEFESIHPFTDGNGRVGRTFFHSYLQHRGLPNAHLCLVERELTKDPELYYKVLGWADQADSYTELVDHFTAALQTSYEEAAKRYREKDLLSTNLPELSKRLLISAKRHGNWFSVNEAARWVEGIGDQTIRSHLNDLVGLHALTERGRTKAKRFRFYHAFDQLRDQMTKFSGQLAEMIAGGKRESAAKSPPGSSPTNPNIAQEKK